MRTIGNILWLVLAGFWLAVGYAVAGIVLCVTIIGIAVRRPVVQARRVLALAVRAGGRHRSRCQHGAGLHRQRAVVGAGGLVARHRSRRHRTGLCLTIIDIPLGVANFKLELLALVPFGKTLVPLDASGGRNVYIRGPEPIG